MAANAVVQSVSTRPEVLGRTKDDKRKLVAIKESMEM